MRRGPGCILAPYGSSGRPAIPNIRDALLHIDDAIDALTLEAEVREVGEAEFQPVDRLQATIAEELDRIERALGAVKLKQLFGTRRGILARHFTRVKGLRR